MNGYDRKKNDTPQTISRPLQTPISPLVALALAPSRLGERPELQEAVEELERRAKGWLESDEVGDGVCRRVASGRTDESSSDLTEVGDCIQLDLPKTTGRRNIDQIHPNPIGWGREPSPNTPRSKRHSEL